MNDLTFFETTLLSFEAIGGLFLVALTGFLFVRRGWMSDKGLSDLSRFMIDVIVPCALSISMIKGFDWGKMDDIKPMLILPPLYILLTVGLTLLGLRMFPGGHGSADRAVAALAAIPNSFYVPFPLALAVTPPEHHAMVGVLLGAGVIAINPLQWSLGTVLVTGNHGLGKRGKREILKKSINGPVIGVIGGIILSFVPGFSQAAHGDPEAFLALRMVMEAMEFLGRAMSPLAMVIIGGLIAQCEFRRAISIRRLFPVLFFRFLFIPGISLILILTGVVPPGLPAFTLLLVSAAPSAMNLAVVAKRYNGEWELVSGLQLVVNVFAVIALPIWMAIGLRM